MIFYSLNINISLAIFNHYAWKGHARDCEINCVFSSARKLSCDVYVWKIYLQVKYINVYKTDPILQNVGERFNTKEK